jgi:hypothetical protein
MVIQGNSSSELSSIAFSLYTGVDFFAVFDLPLLSLTPLLLDP